MPKLLTKEEAYAKCQSDGKYLYNQEIDLSRIRSMLEITNEDLETIKDLKQKKDRWNTVYKLNYDVLHTLTEALMAFDEIRSLNHQCLFSYLCIKHKELELEWNFFEKIRTKRNGIHYYGSTVDINDWKEIEVQISLYIKILKDEINKKLKNET